MVDKLPALHLYVQDYLADTRSLSNEVKGFYMDLLCYMHKSSRRGFLLQPNGNPYSREQLGKMTGCSPDEASRLLLDLLSSEVISATPKAIPYSRRMVRDEKKRVEFQKAGRKGGNPDLGVNYNFPGHIYLMSRSNGETKIGCSVNPQKRMYKIRQALQDSSVSILHSWPVSDMGKEEEKLHSEYSPYRVSGEWFKFSEEILKILLKGNLKGSPEDENKDLRSSPPEDNSALYQLPVRSQESTALAAQAKHNPPGPISPKVEFWEPVCRIFGLIPRTQEDDNRLWQQCQDFRLKGATVADLERRAGFYRQRFPNVAFTPKAVLANWNLLNEPPPPPKTFNGRPEPKKSKALHD